MNITQKRASQLLRKFPRRRVLVVGDLMLDRYVYGSVTRISPEAPVPVVKVAKETSMPGGASNVACNVRALGGNNRSSKTIACRGLPGAKPSASPK